MTGDTYALAVALAHNDMDLLVNVHEAIMDDGISDETYARVFALMYDVDRGLEDPITYAPAEKVWKQNGRTLSDIKLFTALNKAYELVRTYALASWENCVFSAWLPKREIQKAEDKMDTHESIDHAKAILMLAADRMTSTAPSSKKINWAAADEDEEEQEP